MDILIVEEGWVKIHVALIYGKHPQQPNLHRWAYFSHRKVKEDGKCKIISLHF